MRNPKTEQGWERREAAYTEARHQDSTVHKILSAGGTAQDCVTVLVQEKRDLLRRIAEIQVMLPKKIKTSDGKIMVWHCPDDLVPLEAQS